MISWRPRLACLFVNGELARPIKVAAQAAAAHGTATAEGYINIV
jgi:hypothetical protein